MTTQQHEAAGLGEAGKIKELEKKRSRLSFFTDVVPNTHIVSGQEHIFNTFTSLQENSTTSFVVSPFADELVCLDT